MNYLDVELYGGTLSQWLVAAGISTIVILLVRLVKPRLLRRLGTTAKRTRIALDDAVVEALQATRTWLVSIVAIKIGSHALALPPGAQKFVTGVAMVALFVQLGLWLVALLSFWVNRSEARARQTDPNAATSLAAVGFIGRVVLWAVVLLLILDNLGINITTLVAGLGIGGVAVALATQNILGDLFASMSIVIDKPFVVGDFIIVDNYMGSVEHIGMKTTRVRSLDGEQIIFSNSDLLKGRIKNYKRMFQRRVVFPLRLQYGTPREKLARVPQIVRRLLEGKDKVRFERSHFHRLGESSLDVETVFWVLDPDYNLYMDIQQQLNLEVMAELEKEGIRFAFPTRTLTMAGPLRIETAGANLDSDANEPDTVADDAPDEPPHGPEPARRKPGRH